jgi:hypothetical protein
LQIADWFQFISLMTVAITILIGMSQNREVGRQTREASRQTESVQKSLEQAAYQTLNTTHDGNHIAFFKDDPEMLQWFLSTRGYSTSSHHQNKRTLYIIIKLDAHESNFLSYVDGLLSRDVWDGWFEVLRADFEVPDYRAVWPTARRFYATTFVAFVDSLIAARTPEPRAAPAT